MNILVLGGGASNERAVSLRSAAAVRTAIRELGHVARDFDPALGDEKLRQAVVGFDMVFPILHGTGGEDGHIQEVLETTGVPFLGSGSAVSRLCFDKVAFKHKIIEAGLPTPMFAVISAKEPLSHLTESTYVLKPIADGSSNDTIIMRTPGGGADERAKLLSKHERMLVEELIDGIEITVAVLDTKALPIIEIVPPRGQEFDYANKYNGATQELCPPHHVSEAVQARARDMGAQIHKLVGARHLSRTDMIVKPSGELTVLELNTLPGMTDQSLYPKAAAVAGYNFPQLMARFIELIKHPVTSG